MGILPLSEIPPKFSHLKRDVERKARNGQIDQKKEYPFNVLSVRFAFLHQNLQLLQ